ncbi:hypothetical protein [Streptomyces sp. NPDC007094]|uniref:hypothetical protein n=1 Tax=Streptomyces sp. NPDC007094 TaxID=3155359 RepID=UPI0033D1B503
MLPVELEPAKASGGPGDVRIGPVFIEVVTFAEDQKLQDYGRFRQNVRAHLFTLDRGRDINWEGDLPELLSGDVFDARKERTEDAARQRAASGAAVDVHSNAPRRLTVHPGTAPQGTTLTGDTVEADQGRRLLGKVRGKCAKTAGAVPRGSGWRTTAASSTSRRHSRAMSLAAKTDALAALLAPLLAEYVHVAGSVVSNAARRRQPLPPDEDALRPAAQGFQRGLPLDRVRETIVILPANPLA